MDFKTVNWSFPLLHVFLHNLPLPVFWKLVWINFSDYCFVNSLKGNSTLSLPSHAFFVLIRASASCYHRATWQLNTGKSFYIRLYSKDDLDSYVLVKHKPHRKCVVCYYALISDGTNYTRAFSTYFKHVAVVTCVMVAMLTPKVDLLIWS